MLSTHLEVENASLRAALKECVTLIEAWAYGPLFRKAGTVWPDGTCQAPALVNAKKLLPGVPRHGSH